MSARIIVLGIVVEDLDVEEIVIEELPSLERWVMNDELRALIYKAFNGDIRVAFKEAKALMEATKNPPFWAKELAHVDENQNYPKH